MPLRTIVVVLLAAAQLSAVTAVAALAEPDRPAPTDVVYAAPVGGPVVRGFDPPGRPWDAGHRGVDLLALPGQPVGSAAAGTVSFAGTVAGERWVTVRHPDGVRTTYGPLALVLVAAGDAVDRGETVGTVAAGHGPDGASLHWGARRGGDYIDPLTLIGGRLRPALLGPGESRVGPPPSIERYGPWQGRRGIAGAAGFVEGSPLADPDGAGYLLPPNPNHAIGVAGLGSHTDRLPIVLPQLGYADEDTTYLSYAGRRGTRGPDDDPHRDQAPYRGQDTWTGVHAAAERLADQLRAQWARSPGQAVDLIGHSMGGVVITYYLTTMHDPADPTLPPIAHVVTLASPLEGADLATAARSATRNPILREAVLGGARLIGHPIPGPREQVADDLALGSEVTAALREGWEEARRDVHAGPLATGTQVLTLGGSRDLVVPDHRSALPDNPHVVLPGGHDRMRRTEASRVAVRAFLADDPVPGREGGVGHRLSYAVGWTQRAVGAAIGRQTAQPWWPYAPTVGVGWQTQRGDR